MAPLEEEPEELVSPLPQMRENLCSPGQSRQHSGDCALLDTCRGSQASGHSKVLRHCPSQGVPVPRAVDGVS